MFVRQLVVGDDESGHLWRAKWTALSGPLSIGEVQRLLSSHIVSFAFVTTVLVFGGQAIGKTSTFLRTRLPVRSPPSEFLLFYYSRF